MDRLRKTTGGITGHGLHTGLGRAIPRADIDKRFKEPVQFIHAISVDSGILWLMRAVQMNCKDPRWAQSLGLTRTIRNELAVDVGSLELDSLKCKSSAAIIKVLQKFQCRVKSDDDDPDYEWVLDNGKIHVGRFHWFAVGDELCRTRPDSNLPKRLEISKRGILETPGWVQQPTHVLVDDQVEIEVRAVGMNFKVNFRHTLLSSQVTFYRMS